MNYSSDIELLRLKKVSKIFTDDDSNPYGVVEADVSSLKLTTSS